MKKLRAHDRALGMFDQPRSHPYKTLHELFGAFDLAHIRAELNSWMELALCSHESSFSEAGDRKQLLAFCKKLIMLIEALYLLQEARRRAGDHAGSEINADNSTTLPAKLLFDNRLSVLSPSHQANPISGLTQFFKRYTAGYADSMLLDMMEATLMHVKHKKLAAPDPVFFYRCMRGFVRVGRVIWNRER